MSPLRHLSKIIALTTCGAMQRTSMTTKTLSTLTITVERSIKVSEDVATPHHRLRKV
jgi:ubiquitin C-terminal hydrolase